MKYILFVIAVHALTPSAGDKTLNAMAMQEFDSQATCNAAVQRLHALQQAEAIVGLIAFCLVK